MPNYFWYMCNRNLIKFFLKELRSSQFGLQRNQFLLKYNNLCNKQSMEILREDTNIAIWSSISYFIFYEIT